MGDMVVLDAPSWEHLIYQMRAPIDLVVKAGVSVHHEGTRNRHIRTHPATLYQEAATDGRDATAEAAGAAAADPLDCDLSSLAHGLPLSPLPPKSFAALDPAVPHAPRRPVRELVLLPRSASSCVPSAYHPSLL